MQAYSDPRRESEPTALPDLEVFQSVDGYVDGTPFVLPHEPGERAMGLVSGWYWWSCSPGCLPDSEPAGPFETEAEALADAREGLED